MQEQIDHFLIYYDHVSCSPLFFLDRVEEYYSKPLIQDTQGNMAKTTWLQIFATVFQLITSTSGKRYFINNYGY